MFSSITGVVLAGGKSSRMGSNKALLQRNGQTLIKSVLDQLAPIFERVVISVADQNSFPELDFPKIPDRYPDSGPLGAFASLFESGESMIFCVACDMPFLNRELIEFLCNFNSFDAVIPLYQGRAEVLHALYSPNLLPAIQACIRTGRLRVTDALSEHDVKYVTEAEIEPYDPAFQSFRNVNTPQDWAEILKSQ